VPARDKLPGDSGICAIAYYDFSGLSILLCFIVGPIFGRKTGIYVGALHVRNHLAFFGKRVVKVWVSV
jgi:hypothetical protein